MEQKVEELTARLEKAKQVFKEMKSQMDAKDNEIASLKTQLNDTQDLQNQIYDLESKLTNSRNKSKTIEEDLQKTFAELKKYKNENIDFAKKIYDYDININELTTNIEKINQKHHEESDVLRNNIIELQQTIESKENEIEELQLEVSKQKKIAADYKIKSEENSNNAEVKRLQVEYNTLVNKYNEAVKNEKTMSSELAKTTELIKNLTTRLESSNTYEAENVQLKEKIEEIKNERDNVTAKLNENAEKYVNMLSEQDNVIGAALETINKAVTNRRSLPGLHDFLFNM